MFQFGRCPPPCLCIQHGVPPLTGWRVAPFGDRRITAWFPLPDAYRSCPRPSSALDAKASTACLFFLLPLSPVSVNHHSWSLTGADPLPFIMCLGELGVLPTTLQQAAFFYSTNHHPTAGTLSGRCRHGSGCSRTRRDVSSVVKVHVLIRLTPVTTGGGTDERCCLIPPNNGVLTRIPAGATGSLLIYSL